MHDLYCTVMRPSQDHAKWKYTYDFTLDGHRIHEDMHNLAFHIDMLSRSTMLSIQRTILLSSLPRFRSSSTLRNPISTTARPPTHQPQHPTAAPTYSSSWACRCARASPRGAASAAGGSSSRRRAWRRRWRQREHRRRQRHRRRASAPRPSWPCRPSPPASCAAGTAAAPTCGR